MPHVIERASSGRAKCRACGGRIVVDEWRFGERVPNPFGDDGAVATHWFHLVCGSYTRPDAFAEALAACANAIDERAELEREAALGMAHHRLARLRGAERAPTGRATCRSCRALIEKGAWRIGLAFYEDGRFSPAGYLHVQCAAGYCETRDILPRLRHFSPHLTPDDWSNLEALL